MVYEAAAEPGTRLVLGGVLLQDQWRGADNLVDCIEEDTQVVGSLQPIRPPRTTFDLQQYVYLVMGLHMVVALARCPY